MVCTYKLSSENKSGFIWERITGITLEELKKHLEEQFDENMNWDNYGSYWIVDKIISTSHYSYSTINTEFKKAWCLKNMRPLSKIEHTRKKNKIDWELVEKYSLFDILPIGVLDADKNENFIKINIDKK